MLQQDITKELLELSRQYIVKINRLAKLQLLHHSKAQCFKGTPAQFRTAWKQTSSYLKETTLKLKLKGIEKRMSILKLIFWQQSHSIEEKERKIQTSFEATVEDDLLRKLDE